VLVGSSLGGFYATVLAERLGRPAVLFNPAVNPARDLARHIGEQTAWHNPLDRFYFREEFIGELQAMTPAALTRPERYHPVIATGDEVLDWREMAARYAGAPRLLIEGSDHALSDFEARWPTWSARCNCWTPPADGPAAHRRQSGGDVRPVR
jgi:predicted esterase YcpF (UPF0227 family)